MCENQDIVSPGQQNAAPGGASTLVIRGVRVKEAIARFAGDETRYRHWLADFIRHGPTATSQIREATANNATDRAINLVHALKGRTGILGIVELHSIALSLEMTLRNGEPTGFWFEELERTIEEICREIAAALDEPFS